MRKEIVTNNGLKGGMLKGKPHYDSQGNPLGGIKAVVTDQGGKPIEVEGNEVIINKKSVQSDKVLTVKGTPKEILSTINQLDGNGVPIGDEEAEILAKYKTGGSIGSGTIMYHGSTHKIDVFNIVNITLRGIELGSHFGNYKQAESFVSKREDGDVFYIYKCKLNLKNTLKVDDIGWWTADNIYRFILKNKKYNLGSIDFEANTDNVLDFLKREKIDSFKYKNLHEGDGYSYLVFDSSKIEILDIETFEGGGSIGKMSESERKEFYNSPEGKKLDLETYNEWKELVNMTKSELEKFYNSKEGKEAGLSPSEAKEKGIDSGRESARWIIKMKDIPYTEWTDKMWIWAKKQIRFIKRMSGMKGELYDDKGNKTRKHTSLLIWGHNPEKDKFSGGGSIDSSKSFIKWFIEWYKTISSDMNISFSAPNELQPYKKNNVLILDVFEKKNQSIDAKKYLKEIIDKADEFEVTLYLEPSPKHTFFINDEGKKSKITKEYLIKYYNKFGFIEDNGHYSMKRLPNENNELSEGGGIEYFKPYKSVEELAELHNVPVSEIVDQLHIGEKVEMEHTNDYEIARIIALQHIEESPKYYTLLEEMEEKFEVGGELRMEKGGEIKFKPITTPL